MIQRIQTVYLALALILLGFMAWLPLGQIASATNIYVFNIKGVFDSQSGDTIVNGWPLMALLGIIELLQIIIIFSYKKRVRQMRMATYNILLMLGMVAVGWFFIHTSLKEIGEGTLGFEMAMIFPMVAAILEYLAIRAIGKDEALVRSVDRIR